MKTLSEQIREDKRRQELIAEVVEHDKRVVAALDHYAAARLQRGRAINEAINEGVSVREIQHFISIGMATAYADAKLAIESDKAGENLMPPPRRERTTA